MKLLPREQEAIDGIKFCLAYGRRPFRFDILVVLNLIKKLIEPKRRSRDKGLDQMTNWKHEHDCELALRREWSARAQKAERLLREARQYIADAGSDEDSETQTNSAALLAEIDAALKLDMPRPWTS